MRYKAECKQCAVASWRGGRDLLLSNTGWRIMEERPGLVTLGTCCLRDLLLEYLRVANITPVNSVADFLLSYSKTCISNNTLFE